MANDILVAEAVFTVVDTETTGLFPKNDELLEIAAVRVRNLKVCEEEFFQSLICPKRTIPAEVSAIHGITDSMVADAPPLENVLSGFVNFCGESVIVMQNAPFDLGFLAPRLAAVGLPPLPTPIIDTVKLSRFLFPFAKWHKLDDIVRRLNLTSRNRHRALSDALTTADALLGLINIFREKGLQSLSQLTNIA